MDVQSEPHNQLQDLNNATIQWLNDLTAQGIMTTDTALRICSWNHWLERHTGRRAAQVRGRKLLECYPELVTRGLDQSYQQALQGQVVVLAQRLHRYLLPMPSVLVDSRFVQMQQSARIAPLIANGQVIGTITLIEDVTEREAREQDLRRQIKALETLHSVGRAVLSLDLRECLQQLVEAATLLVQAPFGAVVLREEERLQVKGWHGRANVPLYTEADAVSLHSVVAEVARSGHPLWIPDLAMMPGLTPLDPESRSVLAVPLTVEQDVIGVLVLESPQPHAFQPADQQQVAMLVTQAAIGIRNAQLYREAQEAIQLRDTFLSLASHELKTPLTALLGYTHLFYKNAQQDSRFDEREQRALRVMVEQANRLNRIITLLLDLSRIQTGRLSIEQGSFDLSVLIQRLVDESQPLLVEHMVAIHTPNAPLIVAGDELRMEQVVQNLLQNAVKYSLPDTTIRIEVMQRDAYGCISITDEGIGIPEGSLPHVFDRFYRAPNVMLPYQHVRVGMGIGLYVVKEIVALHGGEVMVTSQEGVGSTFTVCIPLQREQSVPHVLLP